MACQQGIRQDLEASKVYYQRKRQPDPFRDYWTTLVRRLYDAPDGFQRLSPPEQTYYLGRMLQGEVYNGGIIQFFDNSSGAYYRETLTALEELGAIQSHGLLVKAKQILFPHDDPPRDQKERSALMPKYPEAPDAPRPDWDVELERISDEFCADPDKLPERLDKYAIDQQLVRLSS
jgi:hypothetical protein